MQRWISFDLLRTSRLPGVKHIKPMQLHTHAAALASSDWVLFPEYWQLNTLLYGYDAKIFPSQATYLIGHDKIEMTRAFQAVAPANTPQTRIHANTRDYAELVWDCMTLPFVAKLAKSSEGKGVWLIENRQDWQRYLQLTDVIYAQEYLPIDRDIRIVFVGTEILAAYWRLQGSDGFHNNIARGGAVLQGPVPQAALDLVQKVASKLQINHAGFDIAMVGQHAYLLEFNRLFGNQGMVDGDKRVQEAIARYLDAHSNPRFPDKPSDQRPPHSNAA